MHSALALTSVIEVLNDAHFFPESEEEKERIGLSESLVMAELSQNFVKSGAFTAANIGAAIGFKGPVTSSSGGLQAIFEASQIIRQGEAEMMVVTGASQEITEEYLEEFEKKGLLSRSKEYSMFAGEGMVLGEGSAGLLLENLEHALARNAKIYGELENYSQAGSKTLYRQSEKPENNSEIIIANASGTEIGDRIEANYIGTTRPVFTIKPNTGWVVSAAGIMDTVIASLILYQGIIPPVLLSTNKFPLNLVKNLTQRQVKNIGVHYVNIGGTTSMLEIGKFSQ